MVSPNGGEVMLLPIFRSGAIEAQPIGGANGCFATAGGIPGKSQARRKLVESPINSGFVGKAGVPGPRQASGALGHTELWMFARKAGMLKS